MITPPHSHPNLTIKDARGRQLAYDAAGHLLRINGLPLLERAVMSADEVECHDRRARAEAFFSKLERRYPRKPEHLAATSYFMRFTPGMFNVFNAHKAVLFPHIGHDLRGEIAGRYRRYTRDWHEACRFAAQPPRRFFIEHRGRLATIFCDLHDPGWMREKLRRAVAADAPRPILVDPPSERHPYGRTTLDELVEKCSLPVKRIERSLRPRQLEIYRRFFSQGQTHGQIAADLQIHANHVDATLRRIRRFFTAAQLPEPRPATYAQGGAPEETWPASRAAIDHELRLSWESERREQAAAAVAELAELRRQIATPGETHDSLVEAIDTLRKAGGHGWKRFDDPLAHLREVTGE